MTRKEYGNLFNNISDAKIKNLKFLNPYLVTTVNKESNTSASINEPKLSATLQEIRISIEEWLSSVTNTVDGTQH